MSSFEEVMEVGLLRAGLCSSLGFDPGNSVEETAANMVMAWPRLAELWPSDSPGREVVSLGLIDGVRERPFIGMEYPPLLAAVRWCLLTQGVSSIEMRPEDDHDLFLPASYNNYRSIGVRVYYDGGPPASGTVSARRKLEQLMQHRIGNGFTDLNSLNTETIPYIGSDWKRTYHQTWHLATDRMNTVLTVAKEGGLTRENHRFEMSSRSISHLERFIILVMPLMDGGRKCTSS